MDNTVIAIPPEAVAALEQGNKIEAIKIVRMASGTGLKESKDAVEQYLHQHQDLFQRYSVIASENNRSSGMKLLLFIAAAAAAAYFFMS
jgi:hypothetical protein